MQLLSRLHRPILTVLALLAALQRAGAAPPADAALAVVRIPSHGCSATVIHTEDGRTFLLGCAHAYEGAARQKPMVLDVPRAAGGPAGDREVEIKLVAVDYRLDLSLVRVGAGPFPQSAGVPARTYRYGNLLSVGYDRMETPAVQQHTDLLAVRGNTTFTVQKPVPGRSGGALLDMDRGLLVGVVQGYETTWPNRGMYVSLPALLKFLARQGWSVEQQGPEGRVDELDDPFRQVLDTRPWGPRLPLRQGRSGPRPWPGQEVCPPSG